MNSVSIQFELLVNRIDMFVLVLLSPIIDIGSLLLWSNIICFLSMLRITMIRS